MQDKGWRNEPSSQNTSLSSPIMDSRHEEYAIAAAVILYHPDDTFIYNLETYYSAVAQIFIIDNTEDQALQVDWSRYPKVSYFHDGQNRGLAVRLNQSAGYAMAAGYHWLLTMDQDSWFTPQSITQYLQCFAGFAEKKEVALFGPKFFRENQPLPLTCSWQKAKRVITSGALMNLQPFHQIGGFDEALFIDSVDHEYCIKASLAGYSIIEFQSVAMVHKVGCLINRSSIKTMFLVKKKKEVHPPLRCYYMLRNLLYLQQKFAGQKVPLMPVIRRDVLKRIEKALFYGRNTRKLASFLLLAYRHFKENKMGKLEIL